MKAVLLVMFCALVGGLAGCVHYPRENDYTACDLRAQELQPVPDRSPFATAEQPAIASGNRGSSILTTLLGESGVQCVSGPDRRFDVLSLSGGGADGAYGAGFLHTLIKKDWDAGKPFSPCLITGVSTGAVMGSYVYLATSKNPDIRNFYLGKLHDLYLGLDDDNLVSAHSTPGMLFSPALYNVDGIRDLARLIADERLLKDIALEYEESKRTFLVGATDLRTGNFDVFNLTAFASRNNPSDSKAQVCYREAVLASAAIPVAFPPVPIKDKGADNKEVKKFYSDGGVRHLMFLNAKLVEEFSGKRKMNVYGVINNTLLVTPNPNAMNFLEMARRNAEIAGNQMAVNAATLVDGYGELNESGRYWASAEGVNCPENLKNGKLFSPPYQACLFEAGQLQAGKSEPWTRLPKRPLLVIQ